MPWPKASLLTEQPMLFATEDIALPIALNGRPGPQALMPATSAPREALMI